MENIAIEFFRLEEVSALAAEVQLETLTDLQLAMIGGGGGDVVFA